MAKMVKKKKKNYRLRKSVRRTLGALFMMSAIIVAAIPFPDAAATEEVPLVSTNERVRLSRQLPTVNFVADSEEKKNSNINMENETTKINLNNNDRPGISTYGDATTKRAYTLLEIDNNWYYEWQYEFYLLEQNGEETNHAIINYYNKSYSTPNIELKQTINTGYPFVEQVTVNNYFNKQLDAENKLIDEKEYFYTINDKNYNINPDTVEGYYIRKYFQSYCDDIKEQLDLVNEGKLDKVTEIKVGAPNVLEDDRLEYYCEKVMGLKNSGYYLQMALADDDITVNDGSGPYNTIYIPKKGSDNAVTPQGYAEDNNGFLYEATQSYILKGIGEEAFYNVDNVTSIKMSSQIEYIGDKAFMDASLVKDIELGNTREIGNFAFKKCTELSTVKLYNSLNVIGTEAFAETKISEISFPGTVKEIGYGAFANNRNLNSIIFENSNSVEIGDYAFFNCPQLSSLDFENEGIIKIGEGAFALSIPDGGTCTEFKFPKYMSVKTETEESTEEYPKYEEFGDCIFAGRENLKTVLMPVAMGNELTYTVKLPAGTFVGCKQLSSVIFPQSCIHVEFDSDVFSQVENVGFYVEGPGLISSSKSDPALPRESTWVCSISNGNEVPYKYTLNGNTYFEVKSDDYLVSLLVNDTNKTAVVGNVMLSPNGSGGKLTIRDTIGGYSIIELGDGCIEETVRKGEHKDSDGTVEGALTELIIGNSVTKLGDSVFEDCPELTSVSLGDGISTIGKRTFANCPKLETITIGGGVTAIGDEAFIDCEKLTYIKFDEPINGKDSFPVSNLGEKTFCTNSPKLIIEGLIDQNYGPFEWTMDKSNYANNSLGIRPLYKSLDLYELGKDTTNKISPSIYVILDDATGLATAIHYPHYNDLSEIYTQKNPGMDLCKAYEAGAELAPAEQAFINSTINVEFFPGIESIDVSGYMNAKDNSMNVATYMEVGDDGIIDTEVAEIVPYSKTYREFGLFNGNYGDPDEGEYNSAHSDNELYEKENRGNDTVEKVIMHTVKSLPNVDEINLSNVEDRIRSGAFYSCERLNEVVLGTAMEDVGISPFLDCYSLNNVDCEGNSSYVFDNKILYGVNPDNSYKLVQVLATRGSGSKLNEASDSNIINVKHDPKLADVSEIGEGAIMECPSLFEVDFTGAENFREIPDDGIRGSSSSYLNVVLPPNVREIGHRAFADMNTVVVTIDGDEVSLASDAFEDTITPIVYAFEDSAAYNTAKKVPNVQVISRDKNCKVRFLDWGGKVLSEQFVAVEGNAELPEEEPTREGYKFTGWDKSHKNIMEDTDIYATYELDKESPYWDTHFPDAGTGNGSGSGSGSGNGSGNGSGSGGSSGNSGDYDENGNKLYTLTVKNGTGGGKFPAGKKVAINADAAPEGSGFANWSSDNNDLIFNDSTKPQTSITMPNKDVTVTANFTGYYNLDVVYGSGSGLYPAGASVTISAVDAPQGRSFASWVVNTSDLKVDNVRSKTTKVTMPAKNAKVTATYMDNGSISGNSIGNSKNNTSIMITKPGISNKDVASAYVSGSSDNFIVKISESLEAADEVQKALQKKYPDMTRIKYFAMDISLYDAKGVNKITDTTGLKVNITMPIPDALREYAGNNRVGAVVNGELETLNPKFTTINGVPSITFTATHFSPYTIYVDTGNLTVSNTLDSTPKTGDGIHPKWFVSIALACISIILFTKKDRRYAMKAYR